MSTIDKNKVDLQLISLILQVKAGLTNFRCFRLYVTMLTGEAASVDCAAAANFLEEFNS